MATEFYFGDSSGKARLVKNAYIGITSLKMTNMIPEINGTSGWNCTSGSMTTSTTYCKYSTNSIGLIGSASLPESHMETTTEIPMIAGHKYYVRAEVYFVDADIRRNTCYWPIAEPNIWNTSSLGLSLSANTWHLLAMVTDRGSAGFSSGNYPLRLDFDNNYKSGTMYVDGVMCIDLTAAYGAGNEPTQSWCNNNIPYFAGTKEFTGFNGGVPYARKITKAYLGDENGIAQIVYQS